MKIMRLCKELGGMVPMVWDNNERGQWDAKGTFTIIDRKNKTIFGLPALTGIQDVWPAPTGD